MPKEISDVATQEDHVSGGFQRGLAGGVRRGCGTGAEVRSGADTRERRASGACSAARPTFVLAVPEYERALHTDAERQLQAAAKELVGKVVRVRAIVGHGDAGREIVRIGKDEAVDMIVISTHGSTGLQHVMFGSVAEKVVRLARRPVLVIPAAKG